MEELNEKKVKAVYAILERPNRKPFFLKIGIVHENRDQSWNIYLDAIPFDRKLHIREEEAKQTQTQFDRPAPRPTYEAGGIL